MVGSRTSEVFVVRGIESRKELAQIQGHSCYKDTITSIRCAISELSLHALVGSNSEKQSKYSQRRMNEHWHIIQLFESFICFIYKSLVSYRKIEDTPLSNQKVFFLFEELPRTVYFQDAQMSTSWRFEWHSIKSAVSLQVYGLYNQCTVCIACYPLNGAWRSKWYWNNSSTNDRTVQKTERCFGSTYECYRGTIDRTSKITRNAQQYPVEVQLLMNSFKTTTFCQLQHYRNSPTSIIYCLQGYKQIHLYRSNEYIWCRMPNALGGVNGRSRAAMHRLNVDEYQHNRHRFLSNLTLHFVMRKSRNWEHLGSK